MQNTVKEIEYGEHFGYSEMFEWSDEVNLKDQLLCRLVQFSEKNPHCIIKAKNDKNIIGVTSINSFCRASNPRIWPYKYVLNEYGDLYLQEKDLAFASKEYDSVNEFSYLKTECKKVHMPILHPKFDDEQKYVPRSNRVEWTKVVLLGKAILEDNGECEAGKYCTIYNGNDENLYGTVQPAKKIDRFKLYVLGRISDHTILVFYTPQIYSTIK